GFRSVACEVSAEYLDFLVNKAADAAVLAYAQRREARIGAGSGTVEGIAFQRRYWMKDGTLRTNPGIGNPDVDRPAGPTDPELTVVRIDAADGTPLGIVANYACHTDTVGGTEFSA